MVITVAERRGRKRRRAGHCGQTRRGRRELVQVGLLLLLLEQHSLMVDVRRLEQMILVRATFRVQEVVVGCLRQLMVLVMVGAGWGGQSGRRLASGQRAGVLHGIVRVLGRLVGLHNLRAEFAEGALAWVYLSLIIFNTNSND